MKRGLGDIARPDRVGENAFKRLRRNDRYMLSAAAWNSTSGLWAATILLTASFSRTLQRAACSSTLGRVPVSSVSME